MFILIVSSLVILDGAKSSSNSFQVTLCTGVKTKNFARKLAIAIYQKDTSQSKFALHNFKLAVYEKPNLGSKSTQGLTIKGMSVFIKDI